MLQSNSDNDFAQGDSKLFVKKNSFIPFPLILILLIELVVVAQFLMGCTAPAPADPAPTIAATAGGVGAAAADVEYARAAGLITHDQALGLKKRLREALAADRTANLLRQAGDMDGADAQLQKAQRLLQEVRQTVPPQPR